MSEVKKGCLTCANYVGQICKLPPEGKEYCLANGDYECWKKAGEEEIAKVTEEMEAAQEQEALSDLQNLVGEEERKISMLEKLADQDKNKQFAGYNGVPLVPGAPPKAKECDNCDHYSAEIGCFLHKYTDCVSNGRYLFSQTAPSAPQP